MNNRKEATLVWNNKIRTTLCKYTVYYFGSSKVVTITKTVSNPLIGITLSLAYRTSSSVGNLKSINLDLSL
jgi:hypothetical protein